MSHNITMDPKLFINDTLFRMIIEAHKGKKEKDHHKKDIPQMIIDHPLLVFAKDKNGNTTLHRTGKKGDKNNRFL